MNSSNNGFADFAKKVNQFGNQLGDNIKRALSDVPTAATPRQTLSSSDDVLGLDAEAFREATIAGNDGGELATYVNEKLVFEAGVDYDSRPMLVFAACRLLNPDIVDYDRLLNLILFRLDDYVESDYSVVLFAANARYKPSIKWLYTAYRQLGRKYKKNLKALYIVHPSKWVQIIMTAMNAVLSPKFAKKVKWIDTLSQLALEVPIDQINIPPEVYQHNATKEADIKIVSPSRSSQQRFFGVPLEKLMGVHGELGLPAPVADALDYLYTHALEVQDLFRRAPSSTSLQQVRRKYEADGNTSVTYAMWGEHVAAAMLKTWCRELPQPIVPSHYYELIRQMPDPTSQPEQAASYARDVVLPALADPPCVSLLLAALFGLLRAVADHSSANRMTSGKLAAAWAPNFVRSSQPDVDISMCSVARFSEPTTHTHESQNRGGGDEDEDEDVLDIGSMRRQQQETNENRPNVVTLVRLMIDQYQVIFRPTLEAAESQARKVPPPKPARRAPPTGMTQNTPTLVKASDEDIAALVDEMKGVQVDKDSPDTQNNSKPTAKPVTATEIAQRLQAEQDAAMERSKNGTANEGSDKGEDEQIIVSGFV